MKVFFEKDRLVAWAAFAVIGVASAAPVLAQSNYPSKPITFVIGFPPGGSTDFLGRLIGQRLADALGTTAVMENRGGANGLIAANIVATAPPDGYTLQVASMGLTTNPYLYNESKRDPTKEFTPISLLAWVANVVVVPAGSPAKDMRGLLEIARTRANPLTSATTGQAAPGHLATELMQRNAGVKFEFIPYKGSGPALIDLIAGRIDMSLPTVVAALPFVKSGKLRALAVTGATRSALMPDVPTLAELKLLEHGSGWYGLVGPAGMPKDVAERLGREVVAIMKQPDVRERFLHGGADPVGSTPAEFGTFIAQDYKRWGDLIRAANIKGEGQ